MTAINYLVGRYARNRETDQIVVIEGNDAVHFRYWTGKRTIRVRLDRIWIGGKGKRGYELLPSTYQPTP